MKREKRKFTPEERLSILQEAQREGRPETLRKYQISPSLFDRWKKKYLAEGFSGLKNQHRKTDPVVKELEEQIEYWKKIVAKQALQIEVQAELLKKTPIGPKIK